MKQTLGIIMATLALVASLTFGIHLVLMGMDDELRTVHRELSDLRWKIKDIQRDIDGLPAQLRRSK